MTSRLRVLARARVTGDDDPPGIAGFVVSAFNPLVAEAVRRCVEGAGDRRDGARAVSGPGTALLLGTCYGDSATSDTASRRLVAGDVHNPLLFYQSVPTTILGHVAREYGITGPVICCSIRAEPAAELREMAAQLLLDEEIHRVLLIEVELAATPRVRHLAAGLAGGPSEDPTGGLPDDAAHDVSDDASGGPAGVPTTDAATAVLLRRD